MLNKLVRNVIHSMWPELSERLAGDVFLKFMDSIQGVFKLDPNAQYIIVVKDDPLGEELVQAMADRFDSTNRIVVLADRKSVV
jgi:hypothetical protein